MNANFRSFFSILFLAATVIITGCGTTGNANQDRVINGALIGAGVGALTALATNPQGVSNNNGNGVRCRSGGVLPTVQECQQQDARLAGGGSVQPQPNGNPCPQGRHTGWQGNRPVCELGAAPQQHVQQIVINNNQQQCGMWNPECNRPLQAPQIAQQPQYGGGQQMQQQQGHPGCRNGAQPYRLPDGRPACMNR